MPSPGRLLRQPRRSSSPRVGPSGGARLATASPGGCPSFSIRTSRFGCSSPSSSIASARRSRGGSAKTRWKPGCERWALRSWPPFRASAGGRSAGGLCDKASPSAILTAMCGICGFVDRVQPPQAAVLGAMAGSLAHRGPDGEGSFVENPVALGHRRLSIIDLSDAASEPMKNEDGSLWLTFNGEIYNFRELRDRLAGRHQFRGQTDAVDILHLYEEQGDDAVKLLDGMFAFALWDTRRNRLLLGRDRAGKKPLFYYHGPGLFAFASEVKALLAHPGIPRERDPAALPLYLTYGYVPTPATFYKEIRAVPPGHFLALSDAGLQGPTPYWRIAFRDGSVPDDRDAEEHLRGLLRAAVARRLVADVPLGAFLSGGLDSSTVVAFMAQEAPSRVRTFSIGFSDHKEYDETSYARLVAQHFGTEHTEFIVEPRALDLIDRLVWHHDGPFGDSSAVPTYLLGELTRTRVTVALSGDGGDEVFAGYLRLYGAKISERLPRWLVKTMGIALRTLPEPKDRKHVLRFAKRFAEVAALP